MISIIHMDAFQLQTEVILTFRGLVCLSGGGSLQAPHVGIEEDQRPLPRLRELTALLHPTSTVY